jgi:hypothetical protein
VDSFVEVAVRREVVKGTVSRGEVVLSGVELVGGKLVDNVETLMYPVRYTCTAHASQHASHEPQPQAHKTDTRQMRHKKEIDL